MLYLTRKIGESVIINDNIEISVVEVRGKSIKLGFTFPSDVSVLRREIYERIQEENRAAAEASPAALDDVELYPGMPAEVMIETGQRTAFDYFLSPLKRGMERAFREQ